MSEVNKNIVPTKLLWVDLEMTGLDPNQDVIIEVAAEITDFKLNKLASYGAIVQQPTQLVEQRFSLNPWWATQTASREGILAGMQTGKPPEVVERELVELVRQHFGDEPAILAGNSIYNDRNFIKHWWPELDKTMHYRMLDVSAWKVWMQGANGTEYVKKDAHRAYDDIQESMAELAYYLNWFSDSRAHTDKA